MPGLSPPPAPGQAAPSGPDGAGPAGALGHPGCRGLAGRTLTQIHNHIVTAASVSRALNADTRAPGHQSPSPGWTSPLCGRPGPTVLACIPGSLCETLRNVSKVNAQTGPARLHGACLVFLGRLGGTSKTHPARRCNFLDNRVPLKLKHLSSQGKATAPRLSVGYKGRKWPAASESPWL